MASQVVKSVPRGHESIYELKFDGYRVLVIKDSSEPMLLAQERAPARYSLSMRRACAGPAQRDEANICRVQPETKDTKVPFRAADPGYRLDRLG